MRKGEKEESIRKGEKWWVGGCDWLACERHKDNGVILEEQPSQQPQFLWELPVQTAFTLSLDSDLRPLENTKSLS